MTYEIRTPLDLLSDDFAFTQQPLLSDEKFARVCRERGAERMSYAVEALRGAGILVPLFRVAHDVRAARRYAGDTGLPLPFVLHSERLDVAALRHARDGGRLRDPSAEPYRPPSRYRRRIGDALVRTSTFAYSPYQLLLLPELRNLEDALRLRRSRDRSLEATLRHNTWSARRAADAGRRNRELAIALSALEPVYRPAVVGRLSLPSRDAWDEWREANASFDPVRALESLRWAAGAVREAAEGLLSAASYIDPLGDWYEVVRLGRPRKWEKLRLAALLAMEHRIAAEMLLLFYEDLVAERAAPPLPEIPGRVYHPLDDRLKIDRSKLEGC